MTRITLTPTGGSHIAGRVGLIEALENRLLFAAAPTIAGVNPLSGATRVPLGAAVTATLNLPNGPVAPLTATTSNFYLYQTAYPNNNEKFVPSWIKFNSTGTAMTLMPLADLLPNTSYTLVVTNGLKDVKGNSFTPYKESFTTAIATPSVSTTYAFKEVTLSTGQGRKFTDVQIGPDKKLYASTTDGQILRFGINADGTLGTPQAISSLKTRYGGNRLISGFAFDPSFVADPSKPMLWVSNTFYALSGATNGPNFTGSLTVMSGPNLATVTDAVTHLPRSISDHVNDQPVFQPGTRNLFFCQAGLNSSGAPDRTWGYRGETLLSAAILKVNTAMLNLNGPALNALTPDVGGTYNPYAAGAPLTIYATGIRNAFTLMFDDRGVLWAPTNGSSAGGNAPAGGGAPALTNIQQTETDTLVKVQQGAYYGHPNPARHQYVLDQGNPSSGAIPSLAFPAYPVGTNPDPNYKLPNFLFGLHSSPDGMIEYHGGAFGGKLDGKFIVAEYAAPEDLLILSRDANDNIIGGLVSKSAGPLPDRRVSGITHLDDPVSLCEDPRSGFLYASEYGESKLALFIPTAVPAAKAATVASAVSSGATLLRQGASANLFTPPANVVTSLAAASGPAPSLSSGFQMAGITAIELQPVNNLAASANALQIQRNEASSSALTMTLAAGIVN